MKTKDRIKELIDINEQLIEKNYHLTRLLGEAQEEINILTTHVEMCNILLSKYQNEK